MMRNLSVRDDLANDTNTTNSEKQTSTSRLPEISTYIEENKQSDSKTPNPSKAPLNYIENMGEWEAAQKKYVDQITQKQQELALILGAYEVKGDELDKFRAERTSLDIEFQKIMGSIINKLSEFSEFLGEIYSKVYQNDSEGTQIADDLDVEENAENGNVGDESEGSGIEPSNSGLSEQIANLLNLAGLQISGVSVVPLNGAEDGGQESGNEEDEAASAINEFLHIVEPQNWEVYSKLLEPMEIKGVLNLYDSIKDSVAKYWDLQYQIENLNNKISKLEEEQNNIDVAYTQGRKEAEKMVEDMDDLNKTYFLNSYLSTKNVFLDTFVSSDLVEKQISNIIELSKRGQTIPKTILLYGKSNLGKTYAANVLASELGRKMYHIKSYDIFTGGFSDPNAMLDTIFTGAIEKKEPCIIFLDEIEDFAGMDNGGAYQNLVENTIRHHISKIKESSLDIMIIGAISNKNKVGSNLLKQDVFSKQIYFTPLSKDKYKKLFYIMVNKGGLKIGDDVNVTSLLKEIKDSDLDQEYLKKLIEMAKDYHQLNDVSHSDNITLSSEDFINARDFMSQYSHNVSQGVGFNNK